MDVYPSTCTLENNDSRNEFVSFFFFLFLMKLLTNLSKNDCYALMNGLCKKKFHPIPFIRSRERKNRNRSTRRKNENNDRRLFKYNEKSN